MRRLLRPIVVIYLTLLLCVATAVRLLAGDLTVDQWQDFDFTDITVPNAPTNLDAHDHISGGTWSIVDASTHLSMATNAEQLVKGTINALSDSGGTRGLAYDCNLTPAVGKIQYSTAAGHTAVSMGYWFFAPAGIASTFGEFDINTIRTDLGNSNLFVKYADQANGTGTGVRIHIFIPSTYSTGTRLDTVALDAWYWIALLWQRNDAAGLKIRIYDVNGAQVGVEETMSTIPAAGDLMNAYEIGPIVSGPQFVGTLRYDDVLVDWTNHVFPLGPGTASGGAPTRTLLGVGKAMQ